MLPYMYGIGNDWIKSYKEKIFLTGSIEEFEDYFPTTKVNANKFLDELGNPYDQIIFDKDGTIGIEWGAFGVPESFLIYNRNIIKKYIGPLNKESINEIKLEIK